MSLYKAQETIRIPISQLTRNEWVKYRWIDVTQFGDSELMLMRGVERMPDDGAQAARDWDLWWKSIEDNMPLPEHDR